MTIYLIGSLRNPEVPKIATELRSHGYDVFDDWHAAGPKADDHWLEYEKARGRSYADALKAYPAQHTFHYDKFHLDRSHAGVLIMPAGKSGHLELGYLIGQGKPCVIYLPEEPERWDVMAAFAENVATSIEELIRFLSTVTPK